jgi:hypothetical protein
LPSPFDRGFLKTPKPRKPECNCQQCGSEVSCNESVCPNCGGSLNSQFTGQFTPYTPDPKKPKKPRTDQNVLLSGYMYNTKTGQFFPADKVDDASLEPARHKIRPKRIPITRRRWDQRILEDDTNTEDELMNTMDDLAIDG